MTKSQQMAAEIANLLRAKNAPLWIVTREEAHVEQHLIEAASAIEYVPMFWDCAAGVTNFAGEDMAIASGDIGAVLDTILEFATTAKHTRTLWILRDATPWVSGTVGVTACRQLRNLAKLLQRTPITPPTQAIIILTPSSDIPVELSGHFTVIEWPLSDAMESEFER